MKTLAEVGAEVLRLLEAEALVECCCDMRASHIEEVCDPCAARRVVAEIDDPSSEVHAHWIDIFGPKDPPVDSTETENLTPPENEALS